MVAGANTRALAKLLKVDVRSESRPPMKQITIIKRLTHACINGFGNHMFKLAEYRFRSIASSDDGWANEERRCHTIFFRDGQVQRTGGEQCRIIVADGIGNSPIAEDDARNAIKMVEIVLGPHLLLVFCQHLADGDDRDDMEFVRFERTFHMRNRITQ